MLKSENEFIEHNNFNGNYYGTSKKEIERISKDGKVCILELDVNGANQIFEIGYPANFIAILPPSEESLTDRLRQRGTEPEEVIEKRVKIGLKELEEIKKSKIFNYQIENSNIDKAYSDLKIALNSLYPKLNI
jgi:guanylate kinase